MITIRIKNLDGSRLVLVDFGGYVYEEIMLKFNVTIGSRFE